MSSTIFSLLTASLIQKVLCRFPQVQSFVFADDTLLFIPGTPQQVRTTLQALIAFLEEYGEVSGYRLSKGRCGVVFQGPNRLPQCILLFGVKVCTKVKYLGTWLGQATIMEQFQGLLSKLMVKA